jgi:hypothetical protein
MRSFDDVRDSARWVARTERVHERRAGRWRARFAALAALLLATLPGAARPAEPPNSESLRFTATRVVAFADVHGAYDELVRALRTSGVVDEGLHWAAGATHVVSLGDVLDRGSGARPALDLLMRLQAEAAAAGGRVHVLLGNHELMNLIGDLRYVPASEFAAYAPAGATPDGDRPPGFGERFAAFAPDGVYGRWLLGLPPAIVLNDTAFVHGGLPPAAARLSPEALDRAVKAHVQELLELRAALAAAGVIAPDADIDTEAERLRKARQPAALPAPDANSQMPAADVAAPRSPEVEAQVQRLIELNQDELLGPESVMWYRGTALCHELLEQPVLEAGLANWGVRRVVMGHTPTRDHRVWSRFGGQALLADTGMLREYFHGQPAALLIEGDRTEVLYPDGSPERAAPEPRAGLEFDGLDAATVERALAAGTIGAATSGTSTEPGAVAGDGNETAAASAAVATPPSGTTLVNIAAGDAQVTALFEPGSRAENARQVAAYRLDRLLGLGMVVPVAAREYGGDQGVVSARWRATVDDEVRAAGGYERTNWCSAGSDYALMYVFDALVRNIGRTPDTMLYDRRTGQFASAGHGNTFGRGRDLPPYLANAPKTIPPALAAALRGLDEATLAGSLGELLSKSELQSLLRRRDDLLSTWTTGESAR